MIVAQTDSKAGIISLLVSQSSGMHMFAITSARLLHGHNHVADLLSHPFSLRLKKPSAQVSQVRVSLSTPSLQIHWPLDSSHVVFIEPSELHSH